MDTKILNRIFGMLVGLAGTAILFESLKDFFYWLSDAGFSFSWGFLAIAGASLIIAAGGTVILLTTLVHKPNFLSKYPSGMQETIPGRILMGVFATDCFVIGVLLLLLGVTGLYGPFFDPEPSIQWRAVVAIVMGLVLAPTGLVTLTRIIPSKPFSLLKS